MTDDIYPQGVDNRFFVFGFDAADLPGYQPQHFTREHGRATALATTTSVAAASKAWAVRARRFAVCAPAPCPWRGQGAPVLDRAR